MLLAAAPLAAAPLAVYVPVQATVITLTDAETFASPPFLYCCKRARDCVSFQRNHSYRVYLVETTCCACCVKGTAVNSTAVNNYPNNDFELKAW